MNSNSTEQTKSEQSDSDQIEVAIFIPASYQSLKVPKDFWEWENVARQEYLDNVVGKDVWEAVYHIKEDDGTIPEEE